jgi:hypothetical protein
MPVAVMMKRLKTIYLVRVIHGFMGRLLATNDRDASPVGGGPAALH